MFWNTLNVSIFSRALEQFLLLVNIEFTLFCDVQPHLMELDNLIVLNYLNW